MNLSTANEDNGEMNEPGEVMKMLLQRRGRSKHMFEQFYYFQEICRTKYK